MGTKAQAFCALPRKEKMIAKAGLGDTTSRLSRSLVGASVQPNWGAAIWIGNGPSENEPALFARHVTQTDLKYKVVLYQIYCGAVYYTIKW